MGVGIVYLIDRNSEFLFELKLLRDERHLNSVQ